MGAVCGEAVVHLYPANTARKVVLAGRTGVEHGTFLDDATLQLMHDRGIFFDLNFARASGCEHEQRSAPLA